MPESAKPYLPAAPDRGQLDALAGRTLVEFGTDWCGHCQAAQRLIAVALEAHPGLRHLKYEDGKGRLLGRSFQVKLWPTLILLQDGRELGRVVRPRDADSMRRLLATDGPA